MLVWDLILDQRDTISQLWLGGDTADWKLVAAGGSRLRRSRSCDLLSILKMSVGVAHVNSNAVTRRSDRAHIGVGRACSETESVQDVGVMIHCWWPMGELSHQSTRVSTRQ